MFNGLCECGSDQLTYKGIVEVEGNTIVEEFRCDECFTIVERRTVVDVSDPEDKDRANFWLWTSGRDEQFLLP